MIDNLIHTFALHGNWVDLVFAALIIYFVITTKGFIASLLELGGFIVTLFLSYQLYPVVGKILQENFTIPKGIAAAAGFFASWFILEFVIYIGIAFLANKYLKRFESYTWNKRLGFLPGIFHACILFLFIVNLVFALPVKGQVKQDILNSRTGPYFVNISQSLQIKLKNVFGGAVAEALNFMAIEPQSGETLKLGFKLSENQLQVDESSETIMLNLLNKERTSRGLPALVADPRLQEVGRAYAKQMFENGFFAHVSAVDGTSPAERADRAGIQYKVIGENLAFAPDVYLAHQGLMNSPGHRANILSPDYGRVGIAVIDGGVYGRIFAQEFRN